MKFSGKTAMLGAVFATVVSLAAAAPASADTWRGDFYSGAPAGVVSVHYGDRSDNRFERMRLEHRRAMLWREMQRNRAHRHFHDRRFDGGDHDRFRR